MVARLCDKYHNAMYLAGLVAVCSSECLKFNTFMLLSIEVSSMSEIRRLRGLRKSREFHPN